MTEQGMIRNVYQKAQSGQATCIDGSIHSPPHEIKRNVFQFSHTGDLKTRCEYNLSAAPTLKYHEISIKKIKPLISTLHTPMN
jgi:hypothetical protein